MITLKNDFQIEHTVVLNKNIDIPSTALPKQYIDGQILIGHVKRCSIDYGQRIDNGGHGVITKIKRTPALNTELCVKSPHKSDFSLCPEAVLQWHTSNTLKAAGIHGAIPHIYDIFQYAGETRFTMDYINGISAVQAVIESADPDSILLQILGQVSLILGFLEETIFFDHRDLKADNLWIRSVAVDYSLKVGGIVWKLKAPFQVVILDFGFACLGDSTGNAVVSLSDGIMPKIDPCPKEGRDLFQLIASMWSIPAIRAKASKSIRNEIDSLLKNKGASFIELVQNYQYTSWVYLAVSDIKFRHPPLHPVALLLKLKRDWPVVNLQ